MKALFVYTRTEANLESSGEAKKIVMQMDGLRDNGVECELIYHNRLNAFNKVLVRLPMYHIYGNQFIKGICKRVIDGHYSAIYIRRYVFDSSFNKLICELRRIKPDLNIIVEVPTFPYDSEWASLVDFPLLVKDRHSRKALKNYVNRIVTFFDDDSIFGVPCIKTSNGIDINKIKKRKYIKRDESIHLLGVAMVEKWHGFDRLIRGISDYYKSGGTENIIFDIVGNGLEIGNLQKIVRDEELSEHVIFHGSMHGEDLNKIFDESDIGVGSLGMYRINLYKGCTLKLREYAARGLPFFYAYNDSLIENSGTPFNIKFSNDNTNIPICDILEFYHKLQEQGYDIVADQLREYASNFMTWKRQMSPVSNYLNSNENQ